MGSRGKQLLKLALIEKSGASITTKADGNEHHGGYEAENLEMSSENIQKASNINSNQSANVKKIDHSNENLAGPSGLQKIREQETTPPGFKTALSPEMIRPLPKASNRTNRTQRKKRKSAILTDTPIKDEIEQEKMSRQNKKQAKSIKKNLSSTQKKTKDRTNIYENFDKLEEDDPWSEFKSWQAKQECRIERVDNCDYTIDRTVLLQELKITKNEEWTLESSNVLHQKEISNFASKTYETNINVSKESKTKSNDSSVSWHPSTSKIGSECSSCSSISLHLAENYNESLEVYDFSRTKTQKNNLEEHKIEQRNTPQEKQIECSLRKGKVWDKKDCCPYCNLDVTNFSTHLFRNHLNEEDVKAITALPKGNNTRKHMIDFLRKQGNFSILNNRLIRPVQRPTSAGKIKTSPGDYLPCKYCKGLYKIKSLKRHAKKCFFNVEKKAGIKYSSEGQTMIAFTESRQTFLDRLRLKTEVFDTMHADRISLTGKSDTLICQYAENYLRKHKRHIKNAVSNKVQELGRLLIPLQDIYGINSMLEALIPENFDKVVAAARIVSGYDDTTKTFQAPTFVLHLRTSLLGVCTAAKSLLLKKDTVLPVTDYEAALKNIKRFSELVQSIWQFAMGSLALKDLNEKNSAKPQTIPVSQDVIAFEDYTYQIAETCMSNLKINIQDIESFKKLTEAILALTIVLNRKRVGDVQYAKLEAYNRDLVSTNQEECLEALTENEISLSKHFKRVVTIGKGNKPVPILFSRKAQEYMNTLLLVREKTDFVPKENPFLFALIRTSSKWVNGSTVLRKFAENCGAKNPSTLTSSRLRKQIATVLQILNLNENEMEQVAKFMGHTKKTHEGFYRLPQDVFQTAKIAKLLLMMDKGVGAENKGRTLNEIDLELKGWNDKNETPNESVMLPNESIMLPNENLLDKCDKLVDEKSRSDLTQETLQRLRYLTEADLDMLFRDRSLGYKTEFRYHLGQWQLENRLMQYVRKKIDSLRAGFRRELREIRKTKRTGTSADSVYESTLWYFDLLLFTQDQEEVRPGTSSMTIQESATDDDDSQSNCTRADTPLSPLAPASTCSSRQSQRSEKNRQLAVKESTLAQKKAKFLDVASTVVAAVPPATSPYEQFGKSVACDLEPMDPHQRTIAQKLISDILYYGKLMRLTEHCSVNIAANIPQTPLYHHGRYDLNYPPQQQRQTTSVYLPPHTQRIQYTPSPLPSTETVQSTEFADRSFLNVMVNDSTTNELSTFISFNNSEETT
ncbi:hypothetical protein RN001_003662 [Aquatica leii]|uniref:Uncharacterized protein n=1 Tax=Aquatica leii TaxID=1421715 RepID=A0AAN7PRD7_9COLE|nr:hypothetical protein RN001_003662 [Aquatica leii]